MAISRSAPYRKLVRTTPPGAGLNLRQVNTSGDLWVVRGFALTLTTDANAGSRAVRLFAQGGDDVHFRAQSFQLQSVSDTRFYVGFAGSFLHTGSESIATLAWPTDGVWLAPGHEIVSAVQNIQVGDILTAIIFDVIEYPDTLPTHYRPGPAEYIVDDQGG